MLFFTNNLVYQIKTGKDADTLIEATKEIKKQLQLGIEKARCLSHGLNPVSLEKKSFQECLIELIQQSQTLYSINCQFHMESDVVINNQDLANHLFRITQCRTTWRFGYNKYYFTKGRGLWYFDYSGQWVRA